MVTSAVTGPSGTAPQADDLRLQAQQLLARLRPSPAGTARKQRDLLVSTSSLLTDYVGELRRTLQDLDSARADNARLAIDLELLCAQITAMGEESVSLEADLDSMQLDLDAAVAAREAAEVGSDELQARLLDQIAQREQLINRVRGNNQHLLRQAARLRAQISAKDAEIAAKNAEIQQAGFRITGLEADLVDRQDEVAAFRVENDGLRAQVTGLRVERDTLILERDRLQAEFVAQSLELYEALVALSLSRHELSVRDRELMQALHEARLKGADIDTLQRTLLFVHGRVEQLEQQAREASNREKSMSSEHNKGQRNLPLLAMVIAVLVAAPLGVWFDHSAGWLSLLSNQTLPGVAWAGFVLAVVVIIGAYFAWPRNKWLDRYIPLYGGEIDDVDELPIFRGVRASEAVSKLRSGDNTAVPPLVSLTDLETAVTTAEGHVTTARNDVATKQGEFDQAKRELDAAVNELVTKTVALAAPLPGGPPAAAAAAEANRKAELQAAKVVLVREQGEYATAKTNLEVAQKGSPAAGAIAAVIGLEGRESDLRNAKAALETRKREIAEALSKRKPAWLSMHGRQLRAVLTIMTLVVLACDHFDVNHTYACVKVARRQPVNGWVSNGVESPREVGNTVEVTNLSDARIDGAITLRRLPPVAPATIGKIEIRGRVVDQNGDPITSDLIWEPNPR